MNKACPVNNFHFPSEVVEVNCSSIPNIIVAPGDYCGILNGYNATCYGNGQCIDGVCKEENSNIGANCFGNEFFPSSTKICGIN